MPRTTIGRNIRRIRKSKGIKQCDLGRMLGHTGINPGALVNRIEHGVSDPRMSTLRKIAMCLQTSVSQLVNVK